MILSQLLQVIKARWGLVLLVFLITVGTTAAASFTMAKRYLATAALVVDIPSRDALGGAVYLPGTVNSFLATQVEVLKSDRVTNRVIDQLGIDKDPAVVAAWEEETGGQGDIRAWISQALKRDVVVVAAREGSYINLQYESKDPVWAANVVNAFAEGFVEATLEMKTEPARNYASTFEKQAALYREQLAQAQERLSAFQKESGIVTVNEESDFETQRLQELSSQLVTLQAAVAESSSRAQTVRSADGDVAEVVASPQIQGLRAELGRVEARYQELSTRLGANHPELRATQAEMQSIRARLQGEIQRMTRSITSTATINQQRLAEVKRELEEQRQKVLSLRQKRDHLALLRRDVESAQRALDLLSDRVTQTTIESAANTSNVAIVTPAAVPSEPSRPKPVLNLLIGSFFGMVLGVIAAVTVEGVQRPLRDTEDLLEAAGVPVLAVLPPLGSRRQQRLIGATGPVVSPPLRLGH